jgi:hypothetical protein
MVRKLLHIFSHPLSALIVLAVMGVLVAINIVPYVIGGFVSVGTIATVLLFSQEAHIKKLSFLIKILICMVTIGLWIAFGYWALGKYHEQLQTSSPKPDSSEILLKALQNKGILEKEDVQYDKDGHPIGLGKKIPGIAGGIILNQPAVTATPAQPEAQPPKESQPDVGLKFVYPKSPALMITTLSGSVARDIKWMVVLWNMDIPERDNPLPIPAQTFDWIKGHDEGGPHNLFDTPLVSPLLKNGNRLFGSATVDCPACTSGKTYIVYIVWGQGGWFSEVGNNSWKSPGKAIAPKNFLRDNREAYFKILEAMIPENKRIPIGER